MIFKEFSYCLSVFYVAWHAYVKAFKSKVQDECMLRSLNTSKITHKLSSCLCNECACISKFFSISNSVVTCIRSCKAREQIFVSHPVKLTAVYDTSANTSSVTVHVFCCCVSYNVCTPFNRAAVDWSWESVVYNKRNTVFMCNTSKFFNIKNSKSRVCNCFTEHGASIALESLIKFFFACIRINECNINSHLAHCYRNKVESSTVDTRRCYNVASCFAKIKKCKKVCSLTGRSKHCSSSAFKFSNFCSYIVVCRILKTCIEITACFKVKKFSHVFTCVIFKSC